MEGKSFEIFKSIDMFDLLSDDKKKAISFYSSLPKVISEAVGRAEKWGTVSTPAQFVAKFRQPAAITLLADLYSGIENQFQFGKSPVGTFITPKVSFLPSDDRETLRKRVKAVLGRKSKTQAQQTLMPEMSFRINVESDQSDLFSIPGIAIQVGDEQNNPKDLFAQVSSKLFSIQVEDSEEVIELVVPGGAPEIIAEESEESVGLNPEDLILPDSVNKTQIKLEYEFYETAEILYKETFGTINWTDMIKFMQKIGCKVEFEDGLGAMISRPECQWKISIRTPHPDMTFKSYEAEIIRCQLEDYYGLYFESFVRK